ncbi:hypothetical protein DPMN_046397 [Dreissena polymorpha]|uniref:Uncharacterized protein n=1 Tax=Dreissena polymorpha TaxID=45954 RepID=A0A9D4D6P4_DREPO|nr:hypothetical protein DPMN_046397 [Dreissena polymorpha]
MPRQRPTRNFGWARSIFIDRVVIRDKLCENTILGGRGLCGLAAPGLVMGSCIVEIDRIVIKDVPYQLEVNRCRHEEVNANLTPTLITFDPGFHGDCANSVGGDSGQDGHTAEITT